MPGSRCPVRNDEGVAAQATPLPLMSRLLGVSSSGYYAWLDRPLSEWARQEARLELEIKAAHRRTRDVYGAEKLQHELAGHGVKVGICWIKRIKRHLGLRCKQKRKIERKPGKGVLISGNRIQAATQVAPASFRPWQPVLLP